MLDVELFLGTLVVIHRKISMLNSFFSLTMFFSEDTVSLDVYRNSGLLQITSDFDRLLYSLADRCFYQILLITIDYERFLSMPMCLTHSHLRYYIQEDTLYYTGVLISPYPDLLPDIFYLMVRIFRLMLVLFYIYIYIYIYTYINSTNILPIIIIIINRIYEHQNHLSL